MSPHGTHARYSKGCRCEDCRIGHRLYEREAARRRRRARQGLEVLNSNLMDATEVREHVNFLRSKGLGLGQIAQLCGTHRATIQYIRRGDKPNITKKLGNKILAIPAIPRVPMAYTSAEPIRKLLAELEKKGISAKDVGRAAGCRYGNLQLKTYMRVHRYNKVESICKEMLRLNP